jgi:two-component system, response regulator
MNIKVILLVEDNLDDVELTRDALQRARIMNELIVMNDGAAALEFLRSGAGGTSRSETLPIVLLLDLNLPKLDGFELLKQIRGDDQLRRLPVVVLTTSQEQEDVFKCYELYADGFVRKPPEVERLHEALRQAGLGWLLVESPRPDPVNIKPDYS